jgi:hypothetical protein
MSVVVERTPEDGRLLVRPPSLAARRPVLSFLAVLGIVCLVLGAVGRAGVAAPQVRMRANGSLDDTAGCVALHSLVNDGLRPAEVTGVSGAVAVGVLESSGDLDPGTAPPARALTAADIPPFAPFTVPGGAARVIAVEVPCPAESFGPDDLVVHVRSVDLGIERDVRPGP